MNNTIVLTTAFPDLTFFSRGKVRDIYDLGDSLLMVSTDRLSAFDVVMAEGIPFKGTVLNRLTEFWFSQIADIVPHHMLTTDVDEFPPACRPYAHILRGRSMLVKKAKPLPVECIVRGYISGSGWKDYQRTGAICGIKLPAGLRESGALPEPIFTPSTKADVGIHDENIDFAKACDLIGREMAAKIRDLSISIYRKARSIAEGKGIIIADTKMEFGTMDGQIILIDELLTPDSSRFWPQQSYAPGRPQMSFDKQFVRDYLESLDWNKSPPPPHLPDDIIDKTSQRYLDAYTWLTGKQITA
jgi:phosphoribosylaminoimidazole-succinocarboxamide synthase